MEFLHLLNDLKHLPRTGWVYNTIPNPESVSDHMYRMAMLAMIYCPSHLDKDRAIKVCLCHDIAEALVGDITPHDPVTPEEKHRRELEAIISMSQMLPEPASTEIKECWLEFEEKKSELAQFCNQLDKIEMCIQANEYEKKYKKDLSSFFTSIPKEPLPCLKKLCDEILFEHQQNISSFH